MANEDKQIRAAEIFNEQCFLVENLKKLSLYNIRATEDTPYKNFTMLEGDPGLAIHDLVTRTGIEELFELTPAQRALLVPRIQIYKISYKTAKSKGEELELVFRDHTSSKSIENINRSRIGRGDDVGIKSFSYELRSKYVAAGQIHCKIVFFFQNVTSLLAGEKSNTTARFIDLLRPEATTTAGKEKGDPRVWNPQAFQIKAVVGWADPSDPSEALIDKKLRKAIQISMHQLHSQSGQTE